MVPVGLKVASMWGGGQETGMICGSAKAVGGHWSSVSLRKGVEPQCPGEWWLWAEPAVTGAGGLLNS